MKMFKSLFTLLVLSLSSFCTQSPKESLPVATPQEVTKTFSQMLATNTITATVTETISPTFTPTRIPPSPTKDEFIPNTIKQISIDNLQNLEVIGEIPFTRVLPEHNIYAIIISDDGNKLASISENWKTRKKALLIWDLATNSKLLEIKDTPDPLWQVYFSQDNEHLWIIREEFLDIYDLEKVALESTVSFPEHDRGSAGISPDGKYIVTGKYQGTPDQSTIRFFHFGSDDPFYTEEMAYMITSFHFSPDSRMVSGTSSRIGSTITKIWNLETNSLLMNFNNYDGGPVFSSDNALVAFAKGSNVSIFSTDSWVLQSSFVIEGSSSAMTPKIFLGDDQILALSDTYNAVFMHVNTGEELFKLPSQVSLINFSPVSNVVFTSWNLDNIKLWGIP